MVISIRLPRLTLGTVSNVIGLAGLAAVAVAIGGLTGVWWWALLVAGVELVAVAYLTGQADEQPAAGGVRPAAAAASGARPPAASKAA
ncbi:hypothetical protein MF672_010825 [Actinomadura sp. ATCC 31491]|uniref:Uncharacterized protein n=1 Tax=Actinomadura luzonensis TaxID=2805427 RepID=A0ABT0FPN6_9ACTN|nr:hypothetical protein [Actinomadura luzonensis]MCK2214280.1 hypothetical protein [Actinomadura luzonensis]